jgi:acyl carrier protein
MCDERNALSRIMAHLAGLPALADVRIDRTTTILEVGSMDSIAIVALISWLEQEFEIEIDPDLLAPEYFASPETITELVVACSQEGDVRHVRG